LVNDPKRTPYWLGIPAINWTKTFGKKVSFLLIRYTVPGIPENPKFVAPSGSPTTIKRIGK
jgi:hypothetical protein